MGKGQASQQHTLAPAPTAHYNQKDRNEAVGSADEAGIPACRSARYEPPIGFMSRHRAELHFHTLCPAGGALEDGVTEGHRTRDAHQCTV